MEDYAIKVTNVKKRYKLGQIGGGTLTADLQSWWAKVRGKEDPNTKIGEEQRSNGDTFMALNGVNLTVKKGEALGIIGGNGAGKSTLLKLLSRVTAPTEGEIDIYGRITSMLEVGTGFNGEMTGRENVYLNGAILGMTKAEVDAKMDEIIEFSEVREFIDTPVKRYSSGMYVKLAFSVAAHLDSEIMIMDEVLAVGDMAFQKKCLDKMRDAATKEGRTVLYVSHNMNTIRQLCDRCVVLDKGKCIFEGDVEEAIAVYLKQSYTTSSFFNYSEYFRSPNETRKFEMLSLKLNNKEDNIFEVNEDINFTLHCRSNEAARNIGFRLEIFYSDGTIAGTTFLDDKITSNSKEEFDVNMTFCTKNLPVGKYYSVALFYENNEFGYQVGVDRVDPAMVFEIVDNQNLSLVWLHQYWGHVKFDEIKLKQIRRS